MTPGPQTTKEKIDKLGLHQNNKLCVSKDIIKKVKKKNQPQNESKYVQSIHLIRI